MLKKYLLAATLLLGVFIYTSCKKTHTCICDITDNNNVTFKQKLVYAESKKKDAETACSAAQTQYKTQYKDAKCALE
jgi:hypothetical protein